MSSQDVDIPCSTNPCQLITETSETEILVVNHLLVASRPQYIGQKYSFTFFVKLIAGNDISVVLQISPDSKEWFIDGAWQTLNTPPLYTTDRTILTADHYAFFARVAATPRDGNGQLAIILQSKQFCNE